MVQKLVEFLLGELAVIRTAWRVIAAAVIVVAALVWWGAGEWYGRKVEIAEASAKLSDKAEVSQRDRADKAEKALEGVKSEHDEVLTLRARAAYTESALSDAHAELESLRRAASKPPAPTALKMGPASPPTGTQILSQNQSGGQAGIITNSFTTNNYAHPPARCLSDDERASIVEYLKQGRPHEVSLKWVASNAEVEQYVGCLTRALEEAGWTIGSRESILSPHTPTGLTMLVSDPSPAPPGAVLLQRAFAFAHVDLNAEIDSSVGDKIVLFVGAQPLT